MKFLIRLLIPIGFIFGLILGIYGFSPQGNLIYIPLGIAVAAFPIILAIRYDRNQKKKYEAAVRSWIGSHKSELIKSWGAPTRVTTDGLDGEILVYENLQLDFSHTGSGQYTPATTHASSTTKYENFYVDKNGKIVDAKWGKK